MSDSVNWPEGNARYLSAALSWLRLRLERQAQREQKGTLLPVIAPAAAPPKRRFFRRASPEPIAATPIALPPGQDLITDEEVAQAATVMAAAESEVTPPPALVMLGQRLGLSRFERDILLLCVSLELDTRIAALCARAQDDPNRPYPTFALTLMLFDDPAWDALSPERPLRYWRLIEINQPGAQPLATSALRADERVVNYVKGLNYPDDRLVSLMAPLDLAQAPAELPPSQKIVVDTILRYWRQAAGTALPLPVIQLVGPDAASKQLVARQAAHELGRHLYRMPAELLPSQAADLELLARLCQRESILLPIAFYLDAQEVDAVGEGPMPALSRLLARLDGIVFLGVRDVMTRLGRENLVLDVTKPSPAEQKAAWAAALGEAAPDSPGLLAEQFNLNLAAIKQITQVALSETTAEDRPLPERLWDAGRARARPRLDTLAQRLDPKVTWDDLVLPDAELSMLHQIADQVRQRSRVYEEWGFAEKTTRGLGINALFAGDSGTGKTMAAEVIANHLRLNLYRIDLSAVVSKYIGETEKNLRRLFDAAEDGGVILFFDEADALFGKRSEVKDSHDRYANIEINYLLQRMEAYRGLAILATNMKSALDSAFMRRLRFIVNFPFPGPIERQRMWQKVFPPGTPTAGLDYDRLARLNLTGGNIYNVAVNASFMAAQASTPVTMPLVLAAARAEFRKLDRTVNEADFRWQASQGAKA